MKRETRNRIRRFILLPLLALVFAGLIALTGCERTASVSGPPQQTLKLTRPADITLMQGQIAPIRIAIDRTGIKEPVAVEFTDLPKGVTVVDATQKIVGDDGSFTLKADENAVLVANHHAKVTAKGPDGIAVTQEFVITIHEKKDL